MSLNRNRSVGLAPILGLAALAFLGGCAQGPAKPVSATPQARLTAVPERFDADELRGLDDQSIALLLGSPGLLRRDEPAQIWQYVDETCILDIFLYEQSGRHIVEYVEARAVADSQPRPTTQSCVDAIMQDRRPLTS